MISTFATYLTNFGLNREVEVTTNRGKIKGKLTHIDDSNNLYLLTDCGHVVVQFKFIIGVQVLEGNV